MPRPGGGEEEKTRAMVTTTGHGYCFSDAPATTGINPNIQTHVVSQFQSFDDSNTEIYGLTTGMEMIGGGFQNKNLHQTSDSNSSVMWKEFFGKSSNNHHEGGPSSSSKNINIVPPAGATEFYQPDFSTGETTLMVAAQESTTTWHDNRVILEEDPSLRCVFPCEGNERPSQGLSLSLGSSSNNPSPIGLQSFELRQPDHEDIIRFVPSSSRDGFFGKSVNIQQQQQQQQMMMQAAEGVLGKVAAGIAHHHHHHQVQFQIRSSKYLGPVQELLNEFCNLGTKQNDSTSKLKFQKTNQWQDQENATTTTSAKMLQSSNLCSLDLLELQKRKAKLLQMLEEVDRRYKHYCNQMRDVVASFEAVAGNRAASVYSALASKAMSKHFRCLRDGIVGQIKTTKKALGEKDTAAPGTTRGETPRLRLIDQTLRQQKAFQQMSMMESHPWRPQRGLPERAVSVLRAWLFEHFLHPYPSDVDKHILARQTGLSRSQVSNWFINARVRLWKPMVEEMYLEETKDHENMGSSDGDNKSLDDSSTGGGRQNQNFRRTHQDQDEEKPTADELVRIDSECLSSIINNNNPHDRNVDITNTTRSRSKTLQLQDEQANNNNNNLQLHHLHSFGRVTDSFGSMELDFSSYNHNAHHHHHQQQNLRGGGRGGGGSVSLTLGLQQHGSSGVSLAFSPTSGQTSLFYAREHDIEDCPPTVQYSLLESEAQNLPYRNLMGAQLLHDLAG